MNDDKDISEENSKEEIPNPKHEETSETISTPETIEQTETRPETQNTKPETENMEVHHHPDLHHKRKHFKEYFLEFLMIFLAVTMGFFAESYREYLNEHSREKEYIHSLIADLKSDQQVLEQHILHVKSGISMMDSMIAILDTPAIIPNHTGELYYLARLAPRLYPLSTNNRTFEQLKNSGNFISLLESINETEFTEYKKVAAKIFDPSIFIKTEGTNNEIKRISNNPPLLQPIMNYFRNCPFLQFICMEQKKEFLALMRK